MKIINNPQNINTTNYEELKQKDEIKTKILKFLAYKKRTEQEVRNKFKQEVNEDILEEIIEYLKEAKYIDDKEYIRKTINNFMALKNLSIREIEYKLYSKGIKKEDIEDYIYENKEELNQYEMKSARNIANKKITSLELEEIKQYLMKKGYKRENIAIALEDI